MACIENIPPAHADSEMEEGEIVDELDDLSDISSEEEFLLRQRLQVLENYNNVLERKKAKNSFGPGKTDNRLDLLQDLSEISATDNDEIFPRLTVNKNNNHERHIKRKKRKTAAIVNLGKNREAKKKPHRIKKKLVPKVVCESSDESDDEYRNKRRKLANAVVVNTSKSDTSSLRARLKKMFGVQSQEPVKAVAKEKLTLENNAYNSVKLPAENGIPHNVEEMNTLLLDKPLPTEILTNEMKMVELIDLCNDDDEMIVSDKAPLEEAVNDIVDKNDAEPTNLAKVTSGDSDEDLELLRQHALKTKANKNKTDQVQSEEKVEHESKPEHLSEDEDSDTAELRLICLKSALLKKAIEMKQKQKLRKRLSQSIHDDFGIDEIIANKTEAENNTDIESVDMEIGSDGDDKLKEVSEHGDLVENMENVTSLNGELNIFKDIPVPKSPVKDEIEEDEDLLRAKLLTSLSKNWSNLVDPTGMDNIMYDVPSPGVPPSTTKSKISLPPAKPFIIKLGDSDSEGEHEATKNLTKMHIKLSEQVDFQQKLDIFLKSTRMEVEKTKLPDVVQQPPEQPKGTPKYVAKTVRHLPKSEQIEYKNLVKRMAELEKIKQARSMNLNKTSLPAKETLKPRNVSTDTWKNTPNDNLDTLIAVSRKKIAEESAKMLRLKEEATKLSQKYKIVATELKNIATAITLNTKERKSVQFRLTKIRLQHQTLIKSSTTNKHSKMYLPVATRNTNKNSSNKLQKENDPSKEEYKNQQMLKSVKVSVANDLKDESVANSRLSIQVEVSSNKKVVKIPKSPTKERTVDFTKLPDKSENVSEENNPIVEKGGGEQSENLDTNRRLSTSERPTKESNDYVSPLEALQSGKCYCRRNCACLHSEYRRFQRFAKGQCVRTSYCDAIWAEDPNSFLCPFEVGGSCKDPDCKYLHPKAPTDQ